MPKQSVLPASQSVHRAIDLLFRPRVVYSRDRSNSGTTKRPGGPAKVLVVEDDYLVASQMEDALHDAGFDVVGVVSSAESAVERAAAAGVTLVIMDVRLTGQRDGVDAAIELFQEHGIRSIFATAHSDAEIRRRAEKAMPAGWLQKPYSMASLIAAVRSALKDDSGRH